MIKMDVFMLLGAILLAYGGIILVYYRLHVNERKNRISNLMLKGTMNMRLGNLERALIILIRPTNTRWIMIVYQKLQMHFTIWAMYIRKLAILILQWNAGTNPTVYIWK